MSYHQLTSERGMHCPLWQSLSGGHRAALHRHRSTDSWDLWPIRSQIPKDGLLKNNPTVYLELLEWPNELVGTQ